VKRSELAKTIDHTILAPDATLTDIQRVCDEAMRFDCASVCVNGARVREIAQFLRRSYVQVCSVVGFPLGAMTTVAKAREAEIAIVDGATEIDMVMNIGAMKEEDYDTVRYDIAAVVEQARAAEVKVILETGLLDKDQIARACRIAVDAGAAFVKTSTGFGHGGATVEDVKLMRETVGDQAKGKASGGIKDLADALALIEAGADRLGMSRTVAILESMPE